TKVDISKVKVGIQVTSGNLTVNMGEIKDVQTGIDMSGSGTLTVNSGAKITFEGAGHGVKVMGTATANLTSVTITGEGSGQGMGVIMESTRTLMMDGGEIKNVEKAVLMKQGTVTMTGVQISKVKMGVEAIKGTLTINGHSRITFESGADNYGVKVKNGASAIITGVEITGGGQGMGVYGEGAKAVTLERVTISEVSEGVWVKGGGKLVIKDGSIGFKDGRDNYGVMVGRMGTANLTGTRIRGEGTGKGVVMGGKMLEMSGGEIKNVELGVLMMGAGAVTLTLTKVDISGVQKGVLMEGAGTLTIKEGTTITFTSGEKNYGIGVGESVTMATVTGTRITGEGSGQGTGVIMESTGTMTMTNVGISQVKMGVWMKNGNLT
uniref:right-handed parallel beta-helix repeat-containing protein n=1 Tax=Bartonella bovis TaxID=155194 RepID=UPI001304CC0B